MIKFDSYYKEKGGRWIKLFSCCKPEKFYVECDKYEGYLKLMNVYEGERWKLDWMEGDDKYDVDK